MDTFSYASYGTPARAIPTAKTTPQVMSSRKGQGRVNYPALAACLLTPWVLFYLTCWVTAFFVHYERPAICCFVLVCGFTGSLFCLGLAGQALRRKNAGETAREPTWYLFLAVTMTAAWIFGVLSGSWIYYGSMETYYDISNLATYPGVDPASSRGQELMDAGRVIFTEGTKIDITMSAGFRNKDVYCVAPIVSGNPGFSRLASYDFWVVGKDCCSTSKPDFHCGEFRSPQARGGLRLLDDADRTMYGLAVQQAVSANGIQARMPLFFQWMEDPIGKVNKMQESGYKQFMLCSLFYFAVQLTLTVLAALKHGASSA